jgi:apolipoprotein N-acyltransferase
VILNFVLSIASAIMLVLLFPRFSFVWLAPAALTPLLIACARETRWKWRFLLGYTAGIVYWFGLCNWIQWTMAEHAGVGGAVAWLLFVLLCLVKALQLGIFAILARNLAAPLIAALWVTLEWTHPYTGFEWLNLGNAASDMSMLLRLAPVTGVWGLSFIFALMSAVIAAILLRRQRLASLWLLLLLGLFLLAPVPAPERGAATAVVIQPNMDDETVWSTELLDRTEEQLRTLSLSLAESGSTDIVVWPEAPAPFYDTDAKFLNLVSSIAKAAHTSLLAGAVAHAPDKAPLNSALLIDPGGAVESRYDKVHLVPFGEFVPWPFGLVTSKVSTEAGDFEAGRDVVVSKLGAHRIATFICYESVFPSYIRGFARSGAEKDGAEALFNISNDSWFGKSQARYQHLQIVRMRAAENRRWIVRATNNGISAVIDPAGRLVHAMPEYREAAARLRYSYRTDQTVYAKYGDWFVALCAAAVLARYLILSLPMPLGRVPDLPSTLPATKRQ